MFPRVLGLGLERALGKRGFELACEQAFDLIILDVMLPKKNGYDVCRDLRQKGINTPI